MAAPSLHPVTLRFPSRLVEAAFLADYERGSRTLVRAALGVGLVQYAAFGVLDPYVAPVAFEEVRAIRVAVCVFLAFAIAATFSERWRRVRPAEAVAVVGGLAVAAMEWTVQHAAHGDGWRPEVGAVDGLLILDGYYYSGLMLVLVYVHVLLRLRFVTASAIGAVLIGAYLGVAATHTTPLRLTNAALFLGSIQVSGMVASYALERYARLEFWRARALGKANGRLSDALERLRAARAQVARQEHLAALGRVTAGAAHEIKNPLNFVTNFAQLSVELADEVAALVDEGRGAEAAELLEDLRANADLIARHGARADAVVKGMLELARPGPSRPEPVDLNALVREHAAVAHHGAHGGLDPCPLAIDLDPAVGLVEALPRDLARVVGPLVTNACQAVRGTGGAVRVSTRRHGAHVEVRVEDDGPGVPADALDRVFEPFFTTRPAGEGVGLGLAIAHEAAAAHGGELAVAEAPDGGAAFVLSLPAPRLEAPSEASSTALALA